MNSNRIFVSISTSLAFAALMLLSAGCRGRAAEDPDFHTSGSREADQRAEQRITRVQQLRGEGMEDTGAETTDNGPRTLYDRLGGEKGIALIVEDWVNRAIADPRVNWTRRGVTRGGWGLGRNKSVEWHPIPENGIRLKKHMAQFLSLSTGGPVRYDGRDMKQVHAHLHITNPEFDAAVGDLQATLDNLGIAPQEQKELLAVIETTRPQVVTRR